jgi:phage recombination protein Bet
MSNDLLKIDWKDAAMVKTMRDTVAKGASNEEFELFCAIAKSTGLNPFLKQIWFIKPNTYTNKQGVKVQPPAQIMTGIDGYRAIANTHQAYDGTIIKTARDSAGKIISCYVEVHRKDRKLPATAEVFFKEYYKPGFNGKESIWDKNGSVMIEKVAESLAMRRAFPLEVGALRTFEEMGVDETDLTQEEKDGAIQGEQVVDPTTCYDLSILEEKGRASAQRYLEVNYARFDDDLCIWVAPKKLEKLTGCIVERSTLEAKAFSADVAAREETAGIEATAKIDALKSQIVTADNLNN